MHEMCDICNDNTANFCRGYCLDRKQIICGNCQKFHGKCETTKYHNLIRSEKSLCKEHGLSIEYICKNTKILSCKQCAHMAYSCSYCTSITSMLTKETVQADRIKTLVTKLEHEKTSKEEICQQLVNNASGFDHMLSDLMDILTTANKLVETISEKKEYCYRQEREMRTQMEISSGLTQKLQEKDGLLKILNKFPNQMKRVRTLLELEHLLIQTEDNVNASTPCEAQNVSSAESDEETWCVIRSSVNALLTLSTALQRQLEDSGLSKQRSKADRIDNVIISDNTRDTLRDAIQMTELKCVKQQTTSGRKRAVSDTMIEHYRSLIVEKEDDKVRILDSTKDFYIRIRIGEDIKRCAITGLVELPDHNILMAGFNNHLLKLFGSDFRFLCHHTFDQSPRDIALFDRDTVAVTIPMGKKIQFVKVTKLNGKYSILLDRQIDVAITCCGISVFNRTIYTATQRPTRILILGENGERKDEIVGDNLDRPTYTVYDSTLDRVYLTDANHKCIYGINSNKEVVFKFNAQDPHGITMDEEANLFVADWGPNIVHHISKDGTPIAQLKLGPAECPQKLFYSIDRKCLYVSLWDSDILRVFYLSK